MCYLCCLLSGVVGFVGEGGVRVGVRVVVAGCKGWRGGEEGGTGGERPTDEEDDGPHCPELPDGTGSNPPEGRNKHKHLLTSCTDAHTHTHTHTHT